MKIQRVPLSLRKIQSLYDHLSSVYDYLTRLERTAEKRALERVNIREGFTVLEVGFGTGRVLLELTKGVGRTGKVVGVDVSSRMVDKAIRKIGKHGLSDRVVLGLGDARHLPYQDQSFDVVFNGHMLDLIDTPDVSKVLLEFKRVLKLGGRLVLVNLSKGDTWISNMKIYEWIYRRRPSLLGGCRPILTKPIVEALRFENVGREFMMVEKTMPIEILWGDVSQSL